MRPRRVGTCRARDAFTTHSGGGPPARRYGHALQTNDQRGGRPAPACHRRLGRPGGDAALESLPGSSRRSQKHCGPPRAHSQRRAYEWCRRLSAPTTGRAAATSGPRRCGRRTRRLPTSGSPRRWRTSTTPPPRRGWQHTAATRPGAPSRRCCEPPSGPAPHESRDAAVRAQPSPTAGGRSAAGPHPCLPPASSARRCTRAGRRSLEHR